jgi:TadE-like protein
VAVRGGSRPLGWEQRGQATVELALCLPILFLALAALVEVGLLVGDQVRLWHAAREGARIAVVDRAADDVRAAAEAAGLKPLEVEISPAAQDRSPGAPLTVALSYRPHTRVPLLGALFARTELHAEATMRIEQP